MNGNQQAARFIRDTTWDGLPDAVRTKVKLCLLDTLGATLVGAAAPVSQITAAYAVEAWKGDEATILLSGKKATAAGAAFANGSAANAVDIDDCALYTKGHPGAQIFPTALAVSEKLAKSGRQMLTSMVIGYEVAHRTARCWHHHHETYQACGSWGSVANAAVASHLMGLNLEEIQNALGIAEYHAPNLPMMRDIDHPAMVKHGIGWGAMTGIIATELAARGFTGIPSILGFEQYSDWIGDIGKYFIMVDGVSFKEYSCCAWSHAALDAARAIMRQHDFRPDEIEHVRVEGFHETVRLGGRLPATTEEAQFNTAWPLATLLLNGRVNPSGVMEASLANERVRALVNKIELVESEELSALAHLLRVGDPEGKYVSSVEITLADGRRLSSGRVSSDTHQQSWPLDLVIDKFRQLAGRVLAEKQLESLIETILKFDLEPSVASLIDLLK